MDLLDRWGWLGVTGARPTGSRSGSLADEMLGLAGCGERAKTIEAAMARRASIRKRSFKVPAPDPSRGNRIPMHRSHGPRLQSRLADHANSPACFRPGRFRPERPAAQGIQGGSGDFPLAQYRQITSVRRSPSRPANVLRCVAVGTIPSIWTQPTSGRSQGTR